MNIRIIAKNGLAVISAILLLVMARLMVDQVQYYNSAKAYLAKGDNRNAVMYFDRVMNAYVPLSPLSVRSREHVIELGMESRKKGDLYMALLCLESARTSIYLTKHIFLPDRGLIDQLNRDISSVKAEMIAGSGSGSAYAAAYNGQARILARDHSPRTLSAFMVIALFLAYLLTVPISIGFNKPSMLPAGIMLFFMWLIALYRA